MQAPIADNFDLHVATVADGRYAFRVSCAQGQTPEPEIAAIPYNQAPTDLWLQHLRSGVISSTDLQLLGNQLFAWLFPQGIVRELYKSSLDQVRHEGRRLRIRLHLSPAALSALPWEYTFDPYLQSFFALNAYTWLVRYLDLPFAPGSVTSLSPVPVLLVAVQPTDYPIELDLADEVAALVKVCHSLLATQAITFDVLFGGATSQRSKLDALARRVGDGMRLLQAPATVEHLRQTIRQGEYRIFHFMGHGDFIQPGMLPSLATRAGERHFRLHREQAEEMQQGGHLLFINEDGLGHLVAGGDLAGLVQDSTLALALLNACQSATASPHEVFTSAAASLIRAGLPAAVAMQSSILDHCAICFARTLYATLADGWPLDAAVTEGRTAIRTEPSCRNLDWGAPVLYLRAPDGQIFRRGVSSEELEKPLTSFSQQSELAVAQARQRREAEQEQIALGLAAYAQRLQEQVLAPPTLKDATPYRGLLSYRLSDSLLFFGRERAVQRLRLVMERDALTILHARSGAGKTSLLQAGIASQLIAAGHFVLLIRPYNQSPTLALIQLLIADLDQHAALSQKPLVALMRRVESIVGQQKRLYIILDQFEEFFTQLLKPAQTAFMEELALCLNDQSLRTRWVLSLRSEYFGQLAAHTQLGAHLLNQFALEELTPEEAQDAVVRPIAAYGIHLEEGLAAAIVADVQQDIDSTDSQQSLAVLPPQLQLVCLTLFETLKLPVEHEITRVLYDRLGRARGILQGRLGQVLQHDLPVALRNPARLLLEALVTSTGQRWLRAQTELEAELARFQVAAPVTQAALDALVEHRLLQVREHQREAAELRYELAHDYLVDKIKLDPGVLRRKAAEELLARALINWRDYSSLMDEQTFPRINNARDTIAIHPDSVELLARSALETSIDPAWWLARCPPSLARTILVDALGRPEGELRTQAAALAQAWYDEPTIQQVLKDAVKSDLVQSVWRQAYYTITSVDPVGAHTLLCALLTSPERAHRLRGLALLPDRPDQRLQDALWVLVCKDTEVLIWRDALDHVIRRQTPSTQSWQRLFTADWQRQAELNDQLRQWNVVLPQTVRLRLMAAQTRRWSGRVASGRASQFVTLLAMLLIATNYGVDWWFGRGWQPLPGAAARRPIQSLLVVADRLYVGGRDDGVQRYQNGAWWTEWRIPPVERDAEGYLPAVTALAVDPAVPDSLLVYVMRNGLYRLEPTNQWRKLGDGVLPVVDQVVLAAHDQRLLYATGSDGLYVSIDNGTTWDHAIDPALGAQMRVAVFNPDGVAYVGGQNGLFRSVAVRSDTDWGEPLFTGPVQSVALGPQGYLYLAEAQSQRAACYVETPTFHRVGNFVPFFWNFPGRTIALLAADPRTVRQFFVADASGRLYAFSCDPTTRKLLGRVSGLQRGVYGIGVFPLGADEHLLVQANGKGIYTFMLP